MRKNNIFHKVVAAVIFILIAGVVTYFFYFNRKYSESDESLYLAVNIENEPVENYEVKETSEGVFIVNDGAGLSLMVPAGWDIEIIEDDKEVELSSPGMITNDKGLFPLNGCAFRLGLARFDLDFPDQELRPQIIKAQINGEREIMPDVQEIITVGNHNSLKTIQFGGHDDGRIIIIETPINNEIYYFGIMYALIDETMCVEKLNEIIESVLID